MLTYHSQKMSKIASERSLACRGCSLLIVGARLPLPARAAACRCDENKNGAVIGCAVATEAGLDPRTPLSAIRRSRSISPGVSLQQFTLHSRHHVSSTECCRH